LNPPAVPLHPFRQGGAQEGTQEEQEAAPNGAGGGSEEQGSLTDTRGDGEDRRDGWVTAAESIDLFQPLTKCLPFTEYNVLQPSPLNEKVLRDKRKKLKETFDRVMRLYVRLA